MSPNLLRAIVLINSKHLKGGNHRPTNETPFERGFTGGLMVARHCMQAGLFGWLRKGHTIISLIMAC